MTEPNDKLSTAVSGAEDKALLNKAQELLELFKTAEKIGFTVIFTPEQWKALIAICEEGHLVKGVARDK